MCRGGTNWTLVRLVSRGVTSRCDWCHVMSLRSVLNDGYLDRFKEPLDVLKSSNEREEDLLSKSV